MEEKQKEAMERAMNPEEFRKLMEELRASNAGQEKYAKKQYRMSQITALASILVLTAVSLTCAWMVPKINTTYENLDLVMGDLKVITSELVEADLGGMIQNVDHLVSESETNINDTMKKVNSLDIEELNQAIKNLSDTVEPLASFFRKFR